MNERNERPMTARERYEQRHPLIEKIGRYEIRKDLQSNDFCVGSPAVWAVWADELSEARELAVKANELNDLGFMLYGFHGVSIFDYDKLMNFARTAHRQQIEQYWLYI